MKSTLSLVLLCLSALVAFAQDTPAAPAPAAVPAASATATAAPASVAAPEVTSQEVSDAIARAVAYLKSRQADDGSWPYLKPEHKQGMAALAVFALSQAGVDENDPAIVKGIECVLAGPLKMNYDAAITALAAVSVNPAKYIRAIADARDALISGQDETGMWSYAVTDARKNAGDGSNTQFAVLGLHAAMSVGLSVPDAVLKRAEDHYARTQNSDGGWGYRPATKSYGSMTAAGVGALHILGARLYVESDKCGQYRQDPRIARGFKWLENNYSVSTNPEYGNENWLYYYLYALERVGVLTGERFIGGHDWYREGARVVIDTQAPDGSWTSGRDMLPNTCFSILFLAKGDVPVLINKLNYGGDWNADLHDAENLSNYVSARFGQRVGWQTVTMEDSLDVLLSAPILYVTGHEFPAFTDAEMAKFSAFFDNGGFLLADACCGSKAFDAGFRAFAARVFPDVPLSPLESSHPVYRSLFNLSSGPTFLEGIEAGCRTNVIYTPRDLSCLWEKNNLDSDEAAFQLGANIAAYVTGKERLVPKLEQYRLITSKKLVTATPGAFTLAQIVYSSGRWNPHPAAGPRLLAFLNREAGLTVSASQVSLPLTDANLANYPFIYLTGCRAFQLTPEEKAALKDYIGRGGFLFSDAACGKPAFDESFRALVSEVFPSSPLEPIPADSAVYRMAFDVSRVSYTASVRELNPALDTLTLYGVKVNGRIAVVYSPYDIGCALEAYPAYGSRGLLSDDAFKVAANIVLFALAH